ncbi:hypothetical protein A9Q84_11930 [Halobacteriovorax marinus]|uniref:Transmembrane protein n=1 Tax=Halobacteriovorax marinus TaxID=97084 RepID=A0A1Y5F8E7_9BACT|nr:hypothetical protein A9Q84_11930 [Halobacteriovorax marinus]
MSTKSSKKLSFLLYDEKKGPIFIRTDKRKLKFILYFLPIVTIVSMLIILAGSVYFKQIREMARRKEPATIKTLKLKNIELTAKVSDLESLNAKFEKKLSAGTTGGSKFAILSLFRPTSGQTDLSSTPVLSIDEPKLFKTDSTLTMKFDILNQTKDARKLAGYIHVIMSTPNKMNFYPQNEIGSEDMLLSYNQGESFAFSRLRHVIASFNTKDLNAPKALFKILIFSRTGDLLFKKLVAKDLK